jgi:peptide chain release factor 1
MVTIVASDAAKGLKHEAGGHRIQRVPPTERKGRVHTSTVTVSVLSDADAVDAAYDRRDNSDFSYRWFGATGAGGQHANKHHNSLDLTHVPTGLSVKSQGRSRASNEREAMEGLVAKLDAGRSTAGREATNVIRAAQVGSGMRGDKIRTYRFRDNSIEDHVTGKSCTCKEFMRGAIDKLWPAKI